MSRHIRISITMMLLPLLLLTAGAAAPAPASGPDIPVIVRGMSNLAEAAAAVRSVGGIVTASLGIIDGVAADVPESAVQALRAIDDVRAVTPDERVEVLGWKANEDDHSVFNALEAIDAEDYWEEGYTGAGIGVALIDTGVAPVEGLDDPGQVIHGPDLSWESQSANVRHLDTFGHGTHMAGLIAGHDDAIDLDDIHDLDDHFVGVAPEAHVISVKVADAQGHTDISQIIAAIDWVVQHRNDPGFNIRVLNLSLGMYSAHDPEDDPLAHATSIAWDRGIVVVAAAGNDGVERTGLTSPAYSERIIAVGAADTDGENDQHKWLPVPFSARGDEVRMPDIVAPGRSLPSLRVPGSHLDASHPSARVTSRYFRGSGTSQAAAMVSGAAALVLQQHPDWTPAMVRGALMANAEDLDPDEGFTPEIGMIGLNLKDMHEVVADPSWAASSTPTPAGSGRGSLEDARGDLHVAHRGVALTGERDIFGVPVDTTALAEARTIGLSWLGGAWNGTQWTGNSMSGSQWAGSQWTGAQWSGSQWTGSQWAGAQWTGSQWTGAQWSSTEYSGSQWSGTTWSSGTWE